MSGFIYISKIPIINVLIFLYIKIEQSFSYIKDFLRHHQDWVNSKEDSYYVLNAALNSRFNLIIFYIEISLSSHHEF